MLKRSMLAAFFLAAAATAYAAAPDMHAIDPDRDGRVSLSKAQHAAADRFAPLDCDKDGTLAKTDHMATEHMASVDSAIKAADADGDGTLDARELSTPAGEELRAMIQ